MDKKKIRKIRLAKGLDQREFAEALGVSKTTVTNWETGLKEPSPKNIKKILDFCSVNKIKI